MYTRLIPRPSWVWEVSTVPLQHVNMWYTFHWSTLSINWPLYSTYKIAVTIVLTCIYSMYRCLGCDKKCSMDNFREAFNKLKQSNLALSTHLPFKLVSWLMRWKSSKLSNHLSLFKALVAKQQSNYAHHCIPPHGVWDFPPVYREIWFLCVWHGLHRYAAPL